MSAGQRMLRALRSARAERPAATDRATSAGLGPARPAADRTEDLSASLGPGAILDPGTRRRMELAFGRAFSGVRVHTGAAGRDLAGRFGAEAVTVDEDIAFAPGRYAPGTPIGDALLAHELAHVAQHDRTPSGSAGGSSMARGLVEDPAAERDADRSAALALVGAHGIDGRAVGRPAGWARPRRTVSSAVAPAICESKSPRMCEAPCEGPATCTIDSAVRPPAGRGALRLRVSGHTCIQAGHAELYRYEGEDPERCNFGDALQPPIMVAPVALGCFELVTPTMTTMVPGIGRLVLVRVVDAMDDTNTAIACARVTAE